MALYIFNNNRLLWPRCDNHFRSMIVDAKSLIGPAPLSLARSLANNLNFTTSIHWQTPLIWRDKRRQRSELCGVNNLIIYIFSYTHTHTHTHSLLVGTTTLLRYSQEWE